MTKSTNDHSVFYRHLKEKIIILVAYIDDLIITGDDVEGIFAFKQILSEQFQLTGLGKLKHFLGIEVSWSYGNIFIYQRNYVLDMLLECGLLGCKLVDSPMVPETKLMLDDEAPPT
jgi:Reverse transcriptase (RNA-dependent DNA polymerase)